MGRGVACWGVVGGQGGFVPGVGGGGGAYQPSLTDDRVPDGGQLEEDGEEKRRPNYNREEQRA